MKFISFINIVFLGSLSSCFEHHQRDCLELLVSNNYRSPEFKSKKVDNVTAFIELINKHGLYRLRHR